MGEFVPNPPPEYVGAHGLLKGKKVLITAAAGGGIGFAVAKRCAEEGAEIVISDIHERRLGEAQEKIAEITGKPCSGILCNVADQEQVDAMFDFAIERLGHIDVLMNNAGLGGTANVVEMTDEQWLKVIDVSLHGTFRCTRRAMQHMMPRGSGAIVNNASVIGWRAQKGQAHYAAAKAGVMALTRCAALEAAEARRAHQCGVALARHAPFPLQGHYQRAAQRADLKRGLWPRCGTLGSCQCDGVSRQ